MSEAEGEAGRRMAGLARPMQHAVNNLFMVLVMNLEAIQGSLPPEDRNAVRLGRALQGARQAEALLRSYLRLGRPEEQGEIDSARFLEAVLPVLNLAAGKPLTLEVAAAAPVRPARPRADIALLALAEGVRGLPASAPRRLRLEGRLLTASWPAPEAALPLLAAAGMPAEVAGEETRLCLGA